MAGAERRMQKDLDAARMRGDLPPEQDSSGKLINPHIPEFMAKAPWYARQGSADSGPSLSHQRRQVDAIVDQSIAALEPLYAATAAAAAAPRAAASKFRAGACKNCGAMTHAERDCVERPRKVGAWKTGSAMAADEVAHAVAASGLKLGWDAKRDQYAGFDASAHTASLAARYAAAEEARQQLREAERAKAEASAAEAAAAREAARGARRAERKRGRGHWEIGGRGPRNWSLTPSISVS